MKVIQKLVVLFALLHISILGFASDTRPITVKATWYGEWHQGKRMANGKPFNMHDALIVAHRTLPLGSILLVRNPSNGKVQALVVQDRGPFNQDPKVKLDLSYAAAKNLGLLNVGKGELEMTVLVRGMSI